MTFSQGDWIYDGTGLLYSAPFVSRCLFYQLHHDDCSLLVEHAPNVASTLRVDKNAGALECDAVVSEPEAFFIHFSDSSKSLAVDLACVPPIRLSPPLMCKSFNKVSVEIERYQLEAKRMFDVIGNSDRSEHEVADAAYRIRSQGTVTHLGKSAPQGEAFFRCWKVSVVSNNNRRSYGLDSPLEWALAAIDPDGWQPTLEMLPKR
jgi:hypothetical protein